MKKGYIVFSLVSFVLVSFVVGGMLLDQKIDAQGEGATFSLYPSSATFDVNDEFKVDLVLNTAVPVTSIKAYLTYDPKLLLLKSIESTNESFPYWWEKEEANGTIKLQASAPFPGIEGKAQLANLKFQGRQAGAAVLAFDPSSLVLTSQDENIADLASSLKAQFTLTGQPSAFSAWTLLLLVFVGLGAVGVMLLRKKNKSQQAK